MAISYNLNDLIERVPNRRITERYDEYEKETYEIEPTFDTTWVNAYELGQGYGGPEEGGWWFDVYDPISSIRVYNEDECVDAIKLLDRILRPKYEDMREYYSAAGGANLVIQLEGGPAKVQPEERPHYE